ncbi:hypothetical protein BDN70DRAFT_874592 [Pholiota conissans]|uniref:Uncharacterized protein n=1 Tax=Pholiota conissans TaxID=109636 RepID=A0A9P5Z811_9AGAR|nr:hypothetical protein BDN70DRAFT_874592 [Pholiota conissans]
MSQLASCPPVFDWAKNAGNDDPCAVGSSLIRLCDNSGQFAGLPLIQPGTTYPLPQHDSANKCTCTSVVYALVSVCSACQNGSYSSWSAWSSSCKQVASPNFPVFTDTSIPQWAFFNVQTEPTFDIVRARNSVTKPPSAPNVTDTSSTPEINNTSLVFTSTFQRTFLTTSSTTPYTITETSPSEAPTSSSELPTSTDAHTAFSQIIPVTQASGADPAAATVKDQSDSQSSPSSATSAGKKSNNMGAIAGGVTAGIIFLLLFGGVVFWVIKRHRRSCIAPSAAYMAAYGTARPPTTMSQRGVSPFVVKANTIVPYHDEDFRSSACLDNRRPSDADYF